MKRNLIVGNKMVAEVDHSRQNPGRIISMSVFSTDIEKRPIDRVSEVQFKALYSPPKHEHAQVIDVHFEP